MSDGYSHHGAYNCRRDTSQGVPRLGRRVTVDGYLEVKTLTVGVCVKSLRLTMGVLLYCSPPYVLDKSGWVQGDVAIDHLL